MVLNLVMNVKVNRKDFYKYISSIRKARVNVGLLLNGAGCLLRPQKKSKCLLHLSLYE